MTLLERVMAAGNGACEAVVHDHDALLERLREYVEKTVSADALASIMAENPERARNEVRSACKQAYEHGEWAAVASDVRLGLMEELVDSVFGLGPLEGLLADEAVTEVMVNGSKSIYYERGGVLHRSPLAFADDDQVRALIDRIISPLGRRIDEASPMVSARLPQGHRVHAIIPPLALDGPTLTIRTWRCRGEREAGRPRCSMRCRATSPMRSASSPSRIPPSCGFWTIRTWCALRRARATPREPGK